MSVEFIHKTTLDYLVNKDYIAKMNSMTENQNQELKNKKDKRFYRKRVFNLTKELLSGELSQDIFPDIKQAFDNYVRHCISYFKAIDCSDIMQEEYLCELHESELLQDDTNKLHDDKLPPQNNMNKLIMRSKPNNLDNFITRVVKNEPKMLMPQQKVMNLRDPSLKIKGVLEKRKKNLTNKYEETKKDNETNNEKINNFEEKK